MKLIKRRLVFAERFIELISSSLKKQVFEEGNASRVTEVPFSIRKLEKKSTKHQKIIPVQASWTVNEQTVYSNLQDERQKRKPYFQLGQLMRTADMKQTISKEESTN